MAIPSKKITKKSVPHVVSRLLDENPFIIELLKTGLINISSLAAKIHSDVEVEVENKVGAAAVSMAIRRYSRTAPTVPPLPRWPKHIDISTRNNLTEIAVRKSERTAELISQLSAELISDGREVSVMMGSYEIVIYSNAQDVALVERRLRSIKKTSVIHPIGCVTVDWPPSTKDIPGIYFLITRVLAFGRVSIQSFHTIGSEMSIFVTEPNLLSAHRLISELLRYREERGGRRGSKRYSE